MNRIDERIDKYLVSENTKKFIGKKIVSTLYNKGVLQLNFSDGSKSKIACEGGNDVSFDSGRESDLKGATIKNLKHTSDYTIEITLSNGKKVALVDDTGGEGINIY
jgi:hypothetical protein